MHTINYREKGKTIIASVIASTFLIGCGGGGGGSAGTTASTGITISGVAVDPELQGATVFLDVNENGQLDANELKTTTDNLGNYSLQIPSAAVGKPLIVKGGIDRVTRKAFTGEMSALSVAGQNSQHITPLTTLVQKYKKANSTKTVATIKNELATKLGLSSADALDKNIITDTKLLKVALQVQKVAQKIAASSDGNFSKIYKTLAARLASDANLSAALDNTITQEIGATSLDAAKAKDLNLELQNSSLDTLTPEQLALSADNIQTNIEEANTTAQLQTNAAEDTTLLVQDANAVELEKGKRTLKALGLSDLDTTTKDKIIEKLKNQNLSNEDIRTKLNENAFGLSSERSTQIKNKIRREALFKENGLANLDTSTKDTLRSKFNQVNFDFNDANVTAFKEKLKDNAFLDNSETLKAKIQGQINKAKIGSITNTTTSLADAKILVGSLMKGPIDGATLMLKDAQGGLVTSTISEKGIFVFPEQNLTSEYYTLESFGGTYDDEATKTLVTIAPDKGLKTLLTQEQLTDILTNKEYIAITPETTLFTELVRNALVNGTDLTTARADAEKLISDTMIKDSSPLTTLEGDKFLQTGNFTTAFPKDQNEAFARNRAIAFSYMVHDLNQTADQVFTLLDKIIEDLKDGKADGITLDSKDINISQEFALSRAKLFQDTTEKLKNSQLSEGQKEQLKQMGFDTQSFITTLASADTNLSTIVNTLLNATSLPTLHILPVLADEDGNTADTKETYTLRATKDVNVTIETPNGSWITPMWRYNNNPLPVVIHAHNGDAMTLNFENNLSADSTIHWHGFKIPADMDGGPDYPIAPNSSKVYSFTMNQPAAPLWFHPHPDMETGKQVYMGLAGVYLLDDALSRELETSKQIPSGAKDTVLLVQDRRFTEEVNGVKELAYKTEQRDEAGMLGDTILVNGSLAPKQEVSNTLHRYRLYNVSNARTYDFALSDDSNFTVIGTDGGLLKNPVSTNHIMLGAAERVEIVIDFSKYNLDEKVMLVSKPFTKGKGFGMASANSLASNGSGFAIMRFDVTKSETEDVTLYDTLPSSASITTRLAESDALNQGNERQFLMSMRPKITDEGRKISFLINNTPFDATKVNEFIATGATEIWSIRNMSPMAHPFHAHAIQYQVLTRNGKAATGTDLGWKDTFLVQPGETVRIIGDFSGSAGDYMYHCHILEHEDAGMMGYFRVGDTGHLGAQ